MHRVARHRKALISYGARFNSTLAEASMENKRRSWTDITIPSREEILKIRKLPSYTPDLSYLRKAPQTSLAGRLVTPKLPTKDVSALTQKMQADRTATLTRQEAQKMQGERLAALARQEKAAKLFAAYTAIKKIPKEEPLDIAAITQKRIEERHAREEERLVREEARKLNFDKAIRTVQDNADILNSFHPMHNSSGPLPLAQSAKKPFAKLPDDGFSPSALAQSTLSDDELSPAALKRRLARRLRESRSSEGRQSLRRSSHDLDSLNSVELDADLPAVEAPEFNGPDFISKTLDDDLGFVQHHPFAIHSLAYRISEIDSSAGGDYSGHTSLSSSISKSTSPAMAVVNTAEKALFCQPNYTIRDRKRAIELVKLLSVAGSGAKKKKRSYM